MFGRRVAALKLASTITILLMSSGGAAFAAQQSDLPTREISVTPTVRIEYDSNVYGVNKAFVPAGDSTRDDLHIAPGVGFNLQMPFSRQALYLNGSVGYDFYKNNSELNRERLDINGGARLNLLGCNPTIDGTYTRMLSNRYALVSVDQIDNTETHRAIGTTVSCGGPLGLTYGGNYRHENVTNSLSLLKILNYNSDSFGANIGYTRPTFGTILLYGNYNKLSYPNRLYIIGGSDIVADGAKIYSAGVSFERNIGSRITGKVSAGYTWVTPKLPISPKFHGASYALNITARPIEALQIDAIASRSASASNLADVAYTITDLYSLQGNYTFSRSLSAQLGASYQKQNMNGSPVNTPFSQADYDFWTANGGLRYTWRKLTFSTDVSHTRRNSRILFQRYNDTRIGFGVSLGL